MLEIREYDHWVCPRINFVHEDQLYKQETKKKDSNAHPETTYPDNTP